MKYRPEHQAELSAGTSNRLDRAFMLLTALVALAYVVLRVFTVSLTADECILYTYKKGYADWITFQFIDAQCHFLQGLLAMFCMDLLPIDEVYAIRIPSVLAFILYLFAAARISQRIPYRLLSWTTFVAFLGNAFMLDFFSLSRGYGFSQGMLLYSVKLLLDLYLQDRDQPHRAKAFLCVWFASFAVWSNLAYLTVYLAICVILTFLAIDRHNIKADLISCLTSWKRFSEFILANQYIVANGAMLGIFYLPRVILLTKHNKLYSGGTTGFVRDTVASLVQRTFYTADIAEAWPRLVAGGLVAASLLLFLTTLSSRAKSQVRKASLLISSLLIITVLLIYGLHYLLEVRYIRGRAALMFIPLFVGQLGFTAAFWKKPVPRATVVACLLLASGIGLYGVNLTYAWTWKHTSCVRPALTILEQLHAEARTEPVILGTSDGLKLLTDYYKKRKGMTWLQHYPLDTYHRFNGRIQVHPKTHYFLIHEPNKYWPVPGEVEVIKRFPAASCVLFRVTGLSL
jgi:hypothetical protein